MGSKARGVEIVGDRPHGTVVGDSKTVVLP